MALDVASSTIIFIKVIVQVVLTEAGVPTESSNFYEHT